jgi:hypothetical protein
MGLLGSLEKLDLELTIAQQERAQICSNSSSEKVLRRQEM